jgi:hypothetical protein
MKVDRSVFLLLAITGAALLSGCVNVSGDPLPARALQRSYCVEHQPKDTRDLHREISDSLQAAGLVARHAPAGDCLANANYRVTYVDRFAWDMRVYLAKLTIEVDDPATGAVVAYGESRQGSLGAMGSSYRDVVDRAVQQLLGRGE